MHHRNTKTKTLVVNLLKSTAIPTSLNDIFTKVKYKLPNTAYSTVYRIVQKLKSQKKVTAIDWRLRGSRYEWAEMNHHHHLVCDSCGDITDIDDNVLNFESQKITQKTGFITKDHSIELYGVCLPCQIKTK